MAKISLILTTILAALVSSVAWAADPYDPTNDLEQAFGPLCASKGALVDQALAQSEVLKSVISSIKNDPLCQGIPTDALEGDLQKTLEAKFTLTQSKLNQKQMRDEITDLKAAIAAEKATAAPDLLYVEALQADLYGTQVSLLKAQQTVGLQKSEVTAQSLANLSAHGKAVMDALAMNEACMNAHPNALGQIGAQILKVSSSWAPGIMGATLLAAGGIIDHFVQLIRNYSINKKLKIILNARLQHAIGCTLEGLAHTYCKSRDAELVKEANQKFQDGNAKKETSTVGEGVNLLSRDLPSFQDFVSNIYAGSKASSQGTAAEKILVANLESGLQNMGFTLDGDTAKYQKNYDNSTTQTDRDNAVRSLIRQLSDDVKNNLNITVREGGNQFTRYGALGDSFSDTACGPMAYYYTNGQQNTCDLTSADNANAVPCESCVAREIFHLQPGNKPPLPPIDQLKANSAAILKLGLAYVSQQQKIYKQDNPQAALTSSETYGANQRMARQFLENARIYLNHLLQEKDGIATGHMRKTINLSLERIGKVLDALDKASIDPQADPVTINSILAALVAPSSDQGYIPTEIQMIVKQDINSKTLNGKIDPDLAIVLQLSTSDSLSELLNHYDSPEALRTQIRSAKRLTEANLEAFGELFENQIEEMLWGLNHHIGANPRNEDTRDELRLFCIQTLLIPSEPQGHGKKPRFRGFCDGQVYASASKKLDLKLDYSEMAAQPFEDRACKLYDFYRKARLYGRGVNDQAEKYGRHDEKHEH